jgi:isorenieratene synthase
MTDSNRDDVFPVVVIGGGIAGLMAAAHLAAGGVPPLLLEADRAWPGGRMSAGEPDTFTHDGRTWAFSSEHGMHALWGSYVNMRAAIERFTDIKLIDSPGEEWINRWGRNVRYVEAGTAVRAGWMPAPFHYLQLLFRPRFWQTITPLDFLSLPGFLFSILWAVGLDPIDEEVALDGLLMEDYFRLWTPNLRATFTGVAINMLAAPPSEITLTGFIAAMRFYTIMRRDNWRMQYLPADAHSCLLRPLIERIEAEEGLVMTGITAQRLEREGDIWRVIVEDGVRGGQRTLYAERVILALNPPAAERLLRAGPATAHEAESLIFPDAVANATVHLWFDASPRDGTPGGMLTGDFLPDNFFWLHRLYDEYREWHAATGGSAIELHLYAPPDVLAATDGALLARCTDEVYRAFPELRGHFVYGSVRRNTRDHTRFRTPTAQTLGLETPWPGILACGDWTRYPTPAFWMERSTTTGIAAANAVLTAHGREPYPIHPSPPPEGLARALQALMRGFRRVIGRPILAVARGLRRKRTSTKD